MHRHRREFPVAKNNLKWIPRNNLQKNEVMQIMQDMHNQDAANLPLLPSCSPSI
jgi:hypothetical protein